MLTWSLDAPYSQKTWFRWQVLLGRSTIGGLYSVCKACSVLSVLYVIVCSSLCMYARKMRGSSYLQALTTVVEVTTITLIIVSYLNHSQFSTNYECSNDWVLKLYNYYSLMIVMFMIQALITKLYQHTFTYINQSLNMYSLMN